MYNQLHFPTILTKDQTHRTWKTLFLRFFNSFHIFGNHKKNIIRNTALSKWSGITFLLPSVGLSILWLKVSGKVLQLFLFLSHTDDIIPVYPPDKAIILGSFFCFSSDSTLDDYNILFDPEASLNHPMPLPVISFLSAKKKLHFTQKQSVWARVYISSYVTGVYPRSCACADSVSLMCLKDQDFHLERITNLRERRSF